jgi:hypothetical protein
MDYRIRPARRSEAKPLVGLYSESGCGKTCSALLLAKGFAGDMARVGMIETESGRGEVFSDDPIIGGYSVISMRDDFSPKNYGQAIDIANKSKLRALIIDSASHEWEGYNGVLGMAAANQAAGKKGPLVWQQPKMDHQREFMLRLMQTPIPLVIVCMRAKYPMKEVKKPDGTKEWFRSEVLEPKQSEDILFEMMVHAWIDAEHKLHITKPKASEKYGVIMRGIFEDGKPITVETGERLAKWAAGGEKREIPGETAHEDALQSKKAPDDQSSVAKKESPKEPQRSEKDYTKQKAKKGYDIGMAVRCPDKPKTANVANKKDCNECAKAATCVAWV